MKEENSFRENQELPDSTHLMNNGSDDAQFSEDEDDIPLGVVIAHKYHGFTGLLSPVLARNSFFSFSIFKMFACSRIVAGPEF